jgi:hypothetical protein
MPCSESFSCITDLHQNWSQDASRKRPPLEHSSNTVTAQTKVRCSSYTVWYRIGVPQSEIMNPSSLTERSWWQQKSQHLKHWAGNSIFLCMVRQKGHVRVFRTVRQGLKNGCDTSKRRSKKGKNGVGSI